MSSILTFAPLLIAVALCVYVILRLRRGVKMEEPGPQGQTPYGPNGWIAFYIGSMYYLAPLYGVMSLTNGLADSERAFPGLVDMSGYATYKLCSWLLLGICLAVQWRVAWLLAHRWMPSSVLFAKTVAFFGPLVMATADYVLGVATLGLPRRVSSRSTPQKA